MQAVWGACQQVAADRCDGSSIKLQIQQLQSLEEVLQCQHQHHTTAAGARLPAAGLPADGSSLQQHTLAQSSGTAPCNTSLPVTAIVVAAGAAVGSLAEVGQQLPLTLCQGYTLDMTPLPPPGAAAAARDTADACCHAGSDASQGCQDHGMSASNNSVGFLGGTAAHKAQKPESRTPTAFPADAPSLLGSPYLASQGGQQLVVGATKQYNISTQQAVAELQRYIDISVLDPHSPQQHHLGHPQDVPRGMEVSSPQSSQGSRNRECCSEAAEFAAAATELLRGAAAVWPAIREWSISGIRSGVRALPPRSAHGAVPMVGHWMDLTAVPHTKPPHPDTHNLAHTTR